jgi:hypothetical protein
MLGLFLTSCVISMARSNRGAEEATLLQDFITRRELAYGKWQTAWELGLGVTNELIRGMPGHEQMEVRNKRLGDEVNAVVPPYPLERPSISLDWIRYRQIGVLRQE